MQELLARLPRRSDGRKITAALLTGSVKGKQRSGILAELASGELSLVRTSLHMMLRLQTTRATCGCATALLFCLLLKQGRWQRWVLSMK